MKNTTPENLAEVINDTEPKEVSKPVKDIAVELDQIEDAFSKVGSDFLSKGLSQSFLSLPLLIKKHLIERENDWINIRWKSDITREKWKEYSLKGYDFRDTILDDLEMGLWDKPDLMKVVSQYSEGKGDEDMLLDIPLTTKFARKHIDLLQSVGITEEYLAEGDKIGEECAALFADVKNAPNDAAPVKASRDKAKTFAADYLELVRFYARRMYRRDKEKRELFISDYYRTRA